ncbi:hypothetical protein [Belliella pelovolcani]|nr:hypothetical protein [Belliella pelovolcani]
MRKHVIFYKLYAEEEIEIIRILSSNMDLKKLIKE